MAVDNFMAFKRLMIKRIATAVPTKDKELEAMREAYRVA